MIGDEISPVADAEECCAGLSIKSRVVTLGLNKCLGVTGA